MSYTNCYTDLDRNTYSHKYQHTSNFPNFDSHLDADSYSYLFFESSLYFGKSM